MVRRNALHNGWHHVLVRQYLDEPRTNARWGGVDEKWRWFDGFCAKAFGLFSQVDLQAAKYRPANVANLDGADKSLTILSLFQLTIWSIHLTIPASQLRCQGQKAGFDTWTQLFAIEALPHLVVTDHGSWVPVDYGLDRVFRSNEIHVPWGRSPR